MPGGSQDADFDGQDGAEVYDESNYDDPENPFGDSRTFEELPDVFDVTTRDGDRDDDEALAFDADEFEDDLIDSESELEEDDELHVRYHAATKEEDDFYDDAGGPGDRYDEDALDNPDNIDGLDEVADADLVSGGEDDFTNFQAKKVGDEDLARMGYADRNGKAIKF